MLIWRPAYIVADAGIVMLQAFEGLGGVCDTGGMTWWLRQRTTSAPS